MKAVLLIVVLGVMIGVGESAVVHAYGSSHVWAYFDPQWVTCNNPGFHLYLSNCYMDIYVFNRQITNWWTGMTQVLVLLKNPEDQSLIAVYHAQDNTNPLPSTFITGQNWILTPGTPNHVVSVSNWPPFRRIHHSTAQTTIWIGPKFQNYILWLRVKLPDVLAGDSKGILIHGCPCDHTIYFSNLVAQLYSDGVPEHVQQWCEEHAIDMDACLIDAGAVDFEFAVNASQSAAEGQRLAEQLASEETVPTPIPTTQSPDRG